MKGVVLLLGVLLVSQIAWAKSKNKDDAEENAIDQEEVATEIDGGYRKVEDPCATHSCPIGKECDLDEEEQPICVCAHACPNEETERAKVCSTTNVTFDSECELHRQKCLCHKHQDGCENREYKHLHMDYYGPCIEIKECSEEEMIDFPVRMREWLFLIMEELAKRDELPKPAKKMAKEAETRPKHWVLPVIWKFCDLDMSHDLTVDPKELMPITAPLKPMEHCTGPFLEKCDSDNDGQIDLNEWAICLGLENDDLKEDMSEMCDELQN